MNLRSERADEINHAAKVATCKETGGLHALARLANGGVMCLACGFQAEDVPRMTDVEYLRATIVCMKDGTLGRTMFISYERLDGITDAFEGLLEALRDLLRDEAILDDDDDRLVATRWKGYAAIAKAEGK